MKVSQDRRAIVTLLHLLLTALTLTSFCQSSPLSEQQTTNPATSPALSKRRLVRPLPAPPPPSHRPHSPPTSPRLTRPPPRQPTGHDLHRPPSARAAQLPGRHVRRVLAQPAAILRANRGRGQLRLLCAAEPCCAVRPLPPRPAQRRLLYRRRHRRLPHRLRLSRFSRARATRAEEAGGRRAVAGCCWGLGALRRGSRVGRLDGGLAGAETEGSGAVCSGLSIARDLKTDGWSWRGHGIFTTCGYGPRRTRYVKTCYLSRRGCCNMQLDQVMENGIQPLQLIVDFEVVRYHPYPYPDQQRQKKCSDRSATGLLNV